MSKGIGGSARIITQDDNLVIYEYYAYNLNNKEYRNSDQQYDGFITIDKHSLVEPEILEKMEKQPNGI